MNNNTQRKIEEIILEAFGKRITEYQDFNRINALSETIANYIESEWARRVDEADIEHKFRCWVSDYKTRHLLPFGVSKQRQDDIGDIIMNFVINYEIAKAIKTLLKKGDKNG